MVVEKEGRKESSPPGCYMRDEYLSVLEAVALG